MTWPPDRLIELIVIERTWLLFHEDCKPRDSSLHDWWHTPFKDDEHEPVLSKDELLASLSKKCGTELHKKLRDNPEERPTICEKFGWNEDEYDRDSCIKKCCEVISAVLEEKDDPVLGFNWKFADQEQNDDTTIEAKNRFKELIFLCNRWLKTDDS